MTFIRLRIWYSHTIPLLLSTCPSSIRWCNATRQKGIFQTHDHTLHHCGKQPHLSVVLSCFGPEEISPGNQETIVAWFGESIIRKKSQVFFGNFLGKNWILIPIFMEHPIYKRQWMGELLKNFRVLLFHQTFRSSCGISSHLFEVASSFCEGNLQNYQGLFFFMYTYHIFIWKWPK